MFLSADNSTVVLSIKGTTLKGPTSKKDKFNDNLYVVIYYLPWPGYETENPVFSRAAVRGSISPGHFAPFATAMLRTGVATTAVSPQLSSKSPSFIPSAS